VVGIFSFLTEPRFIVMTSTIDIARLRRSALSTSLLLCKGLE
jgi:hypothetical protein